MSIIVGRAGDDRLRQLAAAARAASLAYPEVGATRGELPGGYHVVREGIDLGPAASLEWAADGLRSWAPQRGAGARIEPEGAPIAEGETVLVVLRLALVTVVAPCRIVYVTNEPDRWGYAYGTLPGHPEEGEESFHVVRRGGSVRFEVTAFSRPRHPLARAAGPLAHYVQDRVTRRYLHGLRAFVDGAG